MGQGQCLAHNRYGGGMPLGLLTAQCGSTMAGQLWSVPGMLRATGVAPGEMVFQLTISTNTREDILATMSTANDLERGKIILTHFPVQRRSL